MNIQHCSKRNSRRGAVAALMAILMVVMLAMVAFSVDVGYMAVCRTELQGASDSSSLAGAYQLANRQAQLVLYHAKQDNTLKHSFYAGANSARTEAKRFAQVNTAGGQHLYVDLNIGNHHNGDIVLGYVTPWNTRDEMRFDVFPYNAAQVRVYRNEEHTGPLNLFFGRIFGHTQQDVLAVATSIRISAPWKTLPITMHVDDYRRLIDTDFDPGETDDFTFNPDQHPLSPSNYTNRVTGSRTKPIPDTIQEFKLFPDKGKAPGNFGTLDLGHRSGSTDDIKRQILDGQNTSDISEMQQAGLLTNGRLKAREDRSLQISGDPGVSWAVEDYLQQIVGQMRSLPLYRSITKQGTNATYDIVGFVNVVVCYADNGPGGKAVIVQPVAPFRILESPDDNLLGPVSLIK